MKKPNAIIVGGTGQFGITLSKELFKKCMKVIPILVDMEVSGFKLNVFEH